MYITIIIIILGLPISVLLLHTHFEMTAFIKSCDFAYFVSIHITVQSEAAIT